MLSGKSMIFLIDYIIIANTRAESRASHPYVPVLLCV